MTASGAATGEAVASGTAAGTTVTTFGRAVWLLVRKDLTVEVRSREIAYTTLFFAVSCLFVFAFALISEGRAPAGTAEGVLWVAVAFAGTLALGRTFERERQAETLRALLLAPVPRPAIYVGKLCGIVGLLLATEAVIVPLVTFLFQARLLAHPVWLVGILLAGTLGFAAVGTLFAAMLVRARSRDVLLPVLLYPVTVPVIIAGVRGTAALMAPEFDEAIARFWLALLVTFDVVFVTLALWTFEPVMTD
jgi:heme exporter protein B